VLEQAPYHFGAHYLLNQALQRQCRINEAKEAVQVLIEVFPSPNGLPVLHDMQREAGDVNSRTARHGDEDTKK
ncbi:MAG: hypothetical protein WBM84_04930, partial [Sedimenticolaceae bacterium]